MTPKEEATISITVPPVSGDQVDQATERVEQIIEKYTLSSADTDALFEAMVMVFIRSRMIYGDRKPSICSFAGMDEGGTQDKN